MAQATDQERYDAMLSMMETDGWRYFVETVRNDAEIQNNLIATKDQDDLFYRKGALNVLTGILNFEHTLKGLNQYEAEDEDAA